MGAQCWLLRAVSVSAPNWGYMVCVCALANPTLEQPDEFYDQASPDKRTEADGNSDPNSGALSMSCSSGQGPVPVGPLHGPQHPPGHIHLLPGGSSMGCSMEICSMWDS
ncbi:Protocadherin-9 isoform X7 [Aix galericulata]|nr:Protocadherin-9 isoform X7 [Aix galericulata]